MNTAMTTIPGMMLESVDRCRKPNAFQFKRDGVWTSVSSNDFAHRVEDLFHGLLALGTQAEARIAILSENRIEWAIADYAAQTAGAIVVPLYPTLSSTQMEGILKDCNASL